MAIIDMHTIVYSKKDEATRRFFRDVLMVDRTGVLV